MTTHGNDGAFPSSIQLRNICQNSRIKLDAWRETLRRFHLDSIPNLMTTHANDGAFPSSIQLRNICQNSRIKLDAWRETLRRFHLDSIPNLMTTHTNDGAFPSSIQLRNICQNNLTDNQVVDEQRQKCLVSSAQSPCSYHSNCLRNSAKVTRNSANSVPSSSTRSSS